MKKILLTVASLVLATGAFAQGFGSRASNSGFYYQLGDSDFYLQPLADVHFGFDLATNATDEFKDNTSFFKSTQFGFNMLELSFRPYESGAISLGADVEWNSYRLNSDYMFVPYNAIPTVAEPDGNKVSIQNKTLMGIKEVKKSKLLVCTFEFPLNYTQKFGRFVIRLGASAELNLQGCVQFKGVGGVSGTDNIDEMGKGTRHSNQVSTNLFTYNLHGAIGYGGLGLYVKYRPKPVILENYGPQFQTLTLGLMIGLGF